MERPSTSAPPPYRLDELGWLQFERMCELLLEADLGVSAASWIGRADTGRVASVDGPLPAPAQGARVDGPLSVVIAWVPEDAERHRRVGSLVACLEALRSWCGERVMLVSNLDAAAMRPAWEHDRFLARRVAAVWGAGELGERLDRHASVRAAMPSVLGLRDLAPVIAPQARAASSLDVERAQALARVFWPTRAYGRALAVLAAHRFVVLTGPPEMGKTAIAQMLALALMTDGWEAHECTGADQLWRVFHPGRRQVFVADDAFGSTEYRPDSAERWARSLGRLLTLLDDDHWLIWTSRPAPLKAGLTIVEHPHFTPERIRRFVADRIEALPGIAGRDGLERVRDDLERELASPTEAMRTSYRALETEHRDLLIALLDAPAGVIDERELAATVRRHHAGGLSRRPGELIDRLADHFLRVTPLGIGWVHPSWRDLVIDELREDPVARRRFVAGCGLHGTMLALSRAGGVAGERALPLLVDDGDWDRLGDRAHQLVGELEDQELGRLLIALSEAQTAEIASAQWREAHELASELLETIARLWDRRHEPVAVFLIEHWYALRTRAGASTRPPSLAVTWAELYPAAGDERDLERSELARVDEWLALAQILRVHDRDGLAALGFSSRDQELLGRLTRRLQRTTGEPLRPLAESILTRIEELAYGAAHRDARDALATIGLGSDEERWWTPADLVTPPSDDPVPARTGEFGRDDVERVLRDL